MLGIHLIIIHEVLLRGFNFEWLVLSTFSYEGTMKVVFRIKMIYLCEFGDKSSEIFETLHNLIAV